MPDYHRIPLPARSRTVAFSLLGLLLLPAAWGGVAARPAAAPLATIRPPQRAYLPLDPLPWDQGASGLGLALRRLGNTGRVLYVTAHPDDEDNAALMALSRGAGLRVALLTLTRGAGGLNEIGPELFHHLSVLRTEEMMAVHRYDGAEQLFGRAADFGYSFSMEESIQRWGHEQTLTDVVAAMRDFRPHVILTLPVQDAPGGAHHSAAAQLAAEAMIGAADPTVPLPSAPWQPRRLFEGGVGGPAMAAEFATVTVPTAVHDALLGLTWAEAGSLARARHRSQGTSTLKAPVGEGGSRFHLVGGDPLPASVGADLLAGIDTTLPGLAGSLADVPPGLAAALRAAQDHAHAAKEAGGDPRLRQSLQEGRQAVITAQRAAAQVPDAHGLLASLEEEERDFALAQALATGLVVEPVAERAEVVAGQTFIVTTRVWNPGPTPVPMVSVALEMPPGWTATRLEGSPGALAASQALVVKDAVTVPLDARPTGPAWRSAPGVDRDQIVSEADAAASAPQAVVTLKTDVEPLEIARPVYARRPGALGERRKRVHVVPPLSLRVEPPVLPIPLRPDAAREVHVFVRSALVSAGRAMVRLQAPAGWRVRPPAAEVAWQRRDEETAARFTVTPPPGARAGAAELRALAAYEGRELSEAWRPISYEHVEERHLVEPSTARALLLDLRIAPAARVGYVMGAGDLVAEAIRALGVPVQLLDAYDLAQGDLSRFTTIVLGLRAYQTRPDLRAHNRRLLDFAEGGGHVVVQLSRSEFNQALPPAAGAASPSREGSPFAPYPARVSTARVADETAAVRLLLPDHPLLGRPNRIGPGDFEGWVQERGSFLLETADARYRELLAAADPWPRNAGEKKGLLVEATVGRGSWTYVGLNLFRQVAVGTPGAFRVLANLVSRPRGGTRQMRSGG